jgi:hypothetical protein
MLTVPPIHFAFLESLHWGLVDTGALAAIALIGYLFGHRTRATPDQPVDSQLQLELSRASQIARELQQIANRIVDDVEMHQTNIAQFKSRLDDVQHDTTNFGWQILSEEAETLLTPTMKLATNLSLAYEARWKSSLPFCWPTTPRILAALRSPFFASAMLLTK